MVRVPHSTNENLHAQAGLFTLTRGRLGQIGSFLSLEQVVARAIEERTRSQMLAGSDPITRPLRKIVFSRELAPELLRKLADEGVTAAALFPGHYGVVRALEHEALWDQKSAMLRTIHRQREVVEKKWGWR